jgi:hypothetical protein
MKTRLYNFIANSMLLCSVVMTMFVFFIILLKAAWRFLVSIFTDPLIDMLCICIGLVILSVVLIAISPDNPDESISSDK